MTDNDFFFDHFQRSTGQYDRPRWTRRIGALALFPFVAALMGALVATMFIPSVVALNAATTSATSAFNALPTELPIEPTPQRSVMLDRNGDQFAVFFAENRVNLSGDQISQHMKDAQVAIEDVRFFERTTAIDFKALARAAAGNMVSGGNYGGGSTITQQYVKNVLLNNAETEQEQKAATERTIERKIREMRYAMAVEESMSKEDILTAYLNIANYGDGSFGVGAAAQHYFSIPASELSIAQSATLAGIVQNPSRNPVSDPRRTEQRRNHVISEMERAGFISAAEADAARAEPLALNISQPDNGCLHSEFVHYCELVRQELRTDPQFGPTPEARERLLFRGGLTIHTAMDPRVMRIASEAATRALGNDNQFAAGIAVVEPGTGHVVGFGQNRTFDQSQVVYANSGFQNGSTFKPITLAAALEDGHDMATTMHAPARYTAGGKSFRNVSSSGIGTMNAADALAVSSNTYFVKMSNEVTTVERTQQMARRLGVPIPDSATGTETSTTLGVYDVSPIQTANYYGTFAAHGVHCNPTFVTKVTGPMGTIDYDSGCHQELEPGVADTVAHALTTVVDGPNEGRTGKAMSIGRPTMGKTGTTTGNSSVWFAGGTPQYATAVWIGDPRGGFRYPVNRLRIYGSTISGVYGSTAAGPIWRETMEKLHEGLPVEQFSSPSTVSQHVVVPDVVGLSTQSAITVLRDAGVDIVVAGHTEPGAAPETVVAQEPVAGSPLSRRGGTVTITLSDGSEVFVKVGD